MQEVDDSYLHLISVQEANVDKAVRTKRRLQTETGLMTIFIECRGLQ
jgi:hypothetical protein